MDAHQRQSALDRARRGDAPSLGDLLQSFRPYVRAVVSAALGDRLRARLDDSDLVQDALVEAHCGFDEFRGGTLAEFAVWLRVVSRRAAARSLRGLAAGKRDACREQVFPGDVADDGDSPSAAAIRQEQQAQVVTAIAALPEEMQQVLLGRHVDDASHAEIATRLGKSEGAVRVLYVRALERLRQAVPR